jgi:hypothetical protein
MQTYGGQTFGQLNRGLIRPNRDRSTASAVPNPPQPIRVELEVAFDAPRLAPATIATNLQTRLSKILAEHNIASPNVTIEGDTAVLTGVADSESQRLVLEKLVSLEPGVRQVRNEMIVSAPPVAPELPALPALPVPPQPVE